MTTFAFSAGTEIFTGLAYVAVLSLGALWTAVKGTAHRSPE
jgi:hypothetical protein